MRFACSGVAFLIWLLIPAMGLAQERPILDAARGPLAADAQLAGEGPQASTGRRDSVWNGVLIGTGIGLAGGAAGVWAYCQGGYKGACDDEPGEPQLRALWSLIGAAGGGILGWALDFSKSGDRASRQQSVRSNRRMLVVTPIASSSQKALHVTLRY